MFQKIDIWAITRQVNPLQMSVFCIIFAVLLAVSSCHLFWFWYKDYVPDGVTVVTVLVSVLVAAPMVHMFVMTVYTLQTANDRLVQTKTKLNFKNEELAKTKNALTELNQDLEARVTERTWELNEALKIAETANESKSMFLANMSHELRTPLNGIIGFAELIANRKILFADLQDEKIDEYADAIQSSGHHLHSMVSDLLDLSKIEVHQFDINTAPVSLHQIMGDVLQIFEPTAHARRQTIEVNMPEHKVIFPSDLRALHQILTNIVSNALKYSEDDAIVIISVDAAPDLMRFEIRDYGIGMSPEAISNATKPFSRFSDAHIASGESVGLGLSIVSKLCDLLGGKLVLNSVEGHGTTAVVELPVESIDTGEPDADISNPEELLSFAS